MRDDVFVRKCRMLKEKLVDEESKILYEIRKDYCDTEDYISFMKKILNIKKE